MALTESRSLPLGALAPEFSLIDTRNQQRIELEDFNGSPLLVAVICNHCPFVVHLLESFVQRSAEFKELGVETVAISSNDVKHYPQDGPEKMAELAARYGFTFPYLYDSTQAVARAFAAVCTPEFYVFNDEHTLYYHGQWDSSRPGRGSATGDSVATVIEHLVAGKPAPETTYPSVGCSVKWASS